MLDTRRTPARSLVKDLLRIKKQEDTLRLSLPDLTGTRVVDIGCNSGLYSIYASLRGADYVLGIDKNPEVIAQAHDAAAVFRRLGKPLGKVEFRLVDGIQNHLDLLDDKDVAFFCCSLYHVGPLAPVMERIANSRIRMVVLQGNTSRTAGRTRGEEPASGIDDEIRSKGGNVVANVAGMTAFCEGMDFRVSAVHFPRHQYPVVVAERAGEGQRMRVSGRGSTAPP
jgi:SAM-dependent methyltransferase